MPQAPSIRSDRIAAFLESLAAAGRSPATLRGYHHELRALDAAFPLTSDRDLRPSDLRSALAALTRSGLAPRSQRRRLAAWRQYLDWQMQQPGWGPAGHNPARGLRAPRPARRLPKALPVDDMLGLLESAPQAQDWLAARDQALMEVLYSAGIRLSEAVSLDLPGHPQSRSWLSTERAEVLVLGKGSKERLLPLGQHAVAAVQRYLPLRAVRLTALGLVPAEVPALFINRDGGRLSPRGVQRRVAARAQAAGLDQPLHPHMLRHSYASHLLQSSGDLRAVQELLGHAQLTTTEVYTQLDFQRLASVYDVAHPRARRRGLPPPDAASGATSDPTSDPTSNPTSDPQP